MSGEKNLDKLLETMEAVLDPAEFVFCTFSNSQEIPSGLKPICKFRELEGETLIVSRLEAEMAQLSFTYPCRMITLNIHSSLEAVGFLAVITTKLAESGISVNPVSAYYHDHLFVPTERAEQAMKLLSGFSKQSHV